MMTGAGTGICECGCGEETSVVYQTDRNKGIVKGDRRRFVNGHVNRSSPIAFIEDPHTHCWIWQRGLGRGGYGAIDTKATGKARAHRVYYEDFIGPIPEGLTIDHLCRNPACVNPGHLEAVTMRENVLRGDSQAARNARKTHCKRGHPLSGDNLYVKPNGERNCRICRAAQRKPYKTVKC